MADVDTIWVIRPSMDIHSELKRLCADRVGLVSKDQLLQPYLFKQLGTTSLKKMFMFSFFLEEYIKCQIIRPDRYKIAVLSIHGTLLQYS